MLASLLLTLLTQLACMPGETTLVCGCKAGMVSACVTLAGEDTRKAAQVLDQVEAALEQAALMEGKEDEHKARQLQAVAESLSEALGSPEPPCKGQEHHLISRPIAKALSRHSTLKGLFTPRDPRFVARAKDEQSHCGYQQWHRDVDKEVIQWLLRTAKATPQTFLNKLRDIYSRPEMKARFPDGVQGL
ncbi:Wall-associated protein precursor [Archangium primigenium]|uniref:Wall-associated protein precursor n=1 Tax=[Archangium] primigenium TaxID=2792470 RepID=UPI00195EA6A5|nr:Wall-associated protein precursor [Archangium primigenium]MBM7113786.1 Wall-associated protein precursor [Archangium primigenium]